MNIKLFSLSVSLVTTSALLVSCTLPPGYTLPDVTIESDWNNHGASIAQGDSAQVNITWWRQFNDPTLNSLVEEAYSENLGLRVAALRILESRALLGLVKGGLLPQSQAASGQLLHSGRGGSGPDQFINSASIGFDAAWELDFWGKFRGSVYTSEANLLADLADYDDILVSLTAEVATTYVNIRTLEERIRLSQKNVKLQENSQRLVELQLEAGTVTELDLLQAETLLSTTRAQIPSMRSSLIKFYNALAVLLGKTPRHIRGTLAGGMGIPQPPKNVMVGVPSELLRRRPDIRRAEMIALAQGSQIGVARADLYPSFTLIGGLGASTNDAGSGSLDDLFDADNLTYTFGPTFRWNILNYGRIKNNVRVQDARFEQTITVYENTVLNAAREVEDGMTGFAQSREEAEFLRQGVESSQKSSELSMIQYEEGLADYQRVLDSIRSVTGKADQYAAIQGTIATNLIAMYKALGGGWEHRNRNENVPPEMIRRMKERTDWGNYLDVYDSPIAAPPMSPVEK